MDRAVRLNKPLILVKLEADYEPDQWLAELCRGRQVYDLSGDSRHEEWNRIVEQLNQLGLPLNGIQRATAPTTNGLHTLAVQSFISDMSP